ncbi:MAG: mycothiol synthase [Acidimicrobiales bacterium]
MHRLEIKRQMGDDDIAAVGALVAAARAHDGHEPMGEHQWLDLVHGGRQGFAGLVAWSPEHEHPIAYSQVSKGPTSWALEFVVDPHHRGREGWKVAQQLLEQALEVVAEQGGGHVHLWVPKPSTATDRVATSIGLQRGRELLQMRRALPVHGDHHLAVRPFQPGKDERAWLEVNNRAFSWHPEQGGWDLETLTARQSEDWFDPAGFLLHERDGRLAGFCWTKVHHAHQPPLGEIYVIAVDPEFHGEGLGRSLAIAGLNHLHAEGQSVGMLYVDADNKSAVSLYESLGFTVDHTDRAYTGDVVPKSEPIT